MNDKMALGLLAEVMGWTDDEGGVATEEYGWLRLMSAVKYDGYADFRAGIRFLESLATWLKQFNKSDRPAAYAFVKDRLVYISLPELHRLIENFVPEFVTPRIRAVVATELGIKPYEVWKSREGAESFDRHLRQTLFIGMSDGSRIDILRRANNRRLSTEQIAPMMNIDRAKWKDLAKKLAKEVKVDGGAKFEHIYLIDDFTASGTTFIRRDADGWAGKLTKFNQLLSSTKHDMGTDFPVAEGYHLHVHHYVSSDQARVVLDERIAEAKADWSEALFGEVTVTEGLRFPANLKLSSPADADILDLCERYYDPALFERLKAHCDPAVQSDLKRGYANCALPVVLNHNTPNNSIPLLWAETSGVGEAHAMRSLFHRRDRHG